MFFKSRLWATRSRRRAPKGLLDHSPGPPKRHQESPQDRPGPSRMFRRPQDGTKTTPRPTQDGSWTAPRRLGPSWGHLGPPRGPKTLSRVPQEFSPFPAPIQPNPFKYFQILSNRICLTQKAKPPKYFHNGNKSFYVGRGRRYTAVGRRLRSSVSEGYTGAGRRCPGAPFLYE